MAERRDTNLFEILIGQVAKNGEVNVIIGKTLRVLGHPEVLEPIRNVHRRAHADLPATTKAESLAIDPKACRTAARKLRKIQEENCAGPATRLGIWLCLSGRDPMRGFRANNERRNEKEAPAELLDRPGRRETTGGAFDS
jgi:hypothetical protein